MLLVDLLEPWEYILRMDLMRTAPIAIATVLEASIKSSESTVNG